VPKKVREDLKIIPVTHMDQVIEISLAEEAMQEAPRPRRRQEEGAQE
jgi:predicted ATP-dependent protease